MPKIPSPVTALVRWGLAGLLDLATSFVGFGYFVGYATGAVGEEGIALSTAGAATTFALMAGYFLAFARLGGTPWQRIMAPAQAATRAPAHRVAQAVSDA